MSRTLSRDELDYIICALTFQIDHDDGSNPPPLAAGESALEKLVPYSRTEHQTIVFDWSMTFGPCAECSLPAAYVITTNSGGRIDPDDVVNLRCCVCAAQAAAVGESIRWLHDDGEDGGDA